MTASARSSCPFLENRCLSRPPPGRPVSVAGLTLPTGGKKCRTRSIGRRDLQLDGSGGMRLRTQGDSNMKTEDCLESNSARQPAQPDYSVGRRPGWPQMAQEQRSGRSPIDGGFHGGEAAIDGSRCDSHCDEAEECSSEECHGKALPDRTGASSPRQERVCASVRSLDGIGSRRHPCTGEGSAQGEGSGVSKNRTCDLSMVRRFRENHPAGGRHRNAVRSIR